MKKGKAGVLKCSNPDCEDYAYPNLKSRSARTKKKTKTKAKAKKAGWAELSPFLGVLADDEAKIARLVEGEGKDLSEAARALGLSEEEASKLHKRALFKLLMAYGRAKKEREAVA